jgi:hypothetical protein
VLRRSPEPEQYTSLRFGETLALSGLRPSIGSVGDAFDNALAETTIGLYKNECVRGDSPFRRGPLRNLGDVELITADYVGWYNQQRLMHRLDRIPPAESEARYYAQHVTGQPVGSQNPRVHETRDASGSTVPVSVPSRPLRLAVAVRSASGGRVDRPAAPGAARRTGGRSQQDGNNRPVTPSTGQRREC